MLGLNVTPICRASDWPPALHRAVDRLETTTQRVVDARDAGQLALALGARELAKTS